MCKEGNDEDIGSFWAGDHVGLNLAETDAMEKSRYTRVLDLSPELRGAGTEGDRKKPRTNFLSPPREKKNRRRKRSHRGNLKEGRRVLKKSQVKGRETFLGEGTCP